MGSFKSYKELKVWQKGIEIVLLTYKITKSFPQEELFGLSSQMRRCAVSVPSNIAEGWGRDSNKSFVQ
jgi:four helix bundle protein